jgi:hypothetical protein
MANKNEDGPDPDCPICKGTGECYDLDMRAYDCSCVKKRRIK